METTDEEKDVSEEIEPTPNSTILSDISRISEIAEQHLLQALTMGRMIGDQMDKEATEGQPPVQGAPAPRKAAFVNALPSETFTDFFLVTASSLREAKNGNRYIALTLGDKTGTVDAKCWEYKDEIPPTNIFIKVEATAQEYKGAQQLVVKRWRAAREEEIALEDFLAASTRDRDEMYGEVRNLLFPTSEFYPIVMAVLDDIGMERFKNCPAAKSNHQCRLGGLMEHLLGIAKLVNAVCDLYPVLNRDIMIAAAILHDAAKTAELKYSLAIEYSRVGQLVGHIVLGVQLLGKFSHLLAPRSFDHLAHIIVSHHDRPTWGSPKPPMTREAAVFHRLDYIDARIATADILLEKTPPNEHGFTPYSHQFETALYFPERDLEP